MLQCYDAKLYGNTKKALELNHNFRSALTQKEDQQMMREREDNSHQAHGRVGAEKANNKTTQEL